MTDKSRIFKVTDRAQWDAAKAAGTWAGAPVDLADGYIHFSTAPQLPETLRRHFAGQSDLVLIAFQTDELGPALRWEPSRGGALFPHLYGPLDPALAKGIWALSLDADGIPVIPEGICT